MKSLEKGQDKIQAICDRLKRQTLEPAEEEAQRIVAEAKKQRDEIISEGEKHAQGLIKQAKGEIEQQRNVFYSLLQQASKQAIESLRQEVEHRFFNQELQSILEKELAHPPIIAQIINGIVQAVEKEGLETDLTPVIPRLVSAEEVIRLLVDKVRKRLKEKPLEIGNFSGGAQVKLVGKKITIDLTDQAIKELLASYMRKDFRKMIFAS